MSHVTMSPFIGTSLTILAYDFYSCARMAEHAVLTCIAIDLDVTTICVIYPFIPLARVLAVHL